MSQTAAMVALACMSFITRRFWAAAAPSRRTSLHAASSSRSTAAPMSVRIVSFDLLQD